MAASACLFVGIFAQFALSWHLGSSEINPYPDLSAPFQNFPQVLASAGSDSRSGASLWHGRDAENLPAFRAKLPYRVDDLLYRGYTPDQGGPPLYLYMIYSRQGDDRKHHPEICVRDASGAMEDLSARGQVALDAAGERSVMRFRFRTGTAHFTTVYYWHYTLEPMPRKGQSFLQALHQRVSQAAPSMTVQVWLDASPDEREAVEKGFLAAVDSILRKDHLPPTARMGCDRLPIALTRE
jgi:hypothetical protein